MNNSNILVDQQLKYNNLAVEIPKLQSAINQINLTNKLNFQNFGLESKFQSDNKIDQLLVKLNKNE